MIFDGKQLEEDRSTLLDYGIDMKSLHLICVILTYIHVKVTADLHITSSITVK